MLLIPMAWLALMNALDVMEPKGVDMAHYRRYPGWTGTCLLKP